MILNVEEIKDYEVDGSDDVEGGEVSIDISNMGLFYDMMSKSIYSNPHGSIVRELVSNAFDAHQEIEVKKPVIIKAAYEESEYYLSIQDFGVGISKERFHDVYLKYLSSTKRHTNKLMGSFGLGSKSPFSYTDVFYVRTRFEGVEYYYAMSKGNDMKPKWDLLYEKGTIEESGTTIKFIIEGGKYSTDSDKFQAEIVNQLRYFDDVYVEGFNIPNEYEIIDYPTFKYRKVKETDTNMHIALGKVTYPIDWKTIKREAIRIPVGVKFEIGELMITSNRESIRYNDDVIALINRKIDRCLKELENLADSGAYDTLAELLKAKKETTKVIKLTETVSLPIYPYAQIRYGEDEKYPFYIPKPQWKPFAGTPIAVPDNPFFIFRSVGFIDSNGSYINVREDSKKRGRLPYKYEDIYHLATTSKVPIYRTNDFVVNRMKLNYIGHLHSFGTNAVIAIDKQRGVVNTLKQIGLLEKKDKVQKIWRRDDERSKRTTTPEITEGWNKVKLLKLYRREITKEIIRLSKSYDTLEVPEDYVKSYKSKYVTTRLVPTAEEIPLMDISIGEESKKLVKLKDLRAGLIVYGNNQDRNKLIAVTRLLGGRRWYPGNTYAKAKHRAYRVVALNLTDVKKMTEKNQISVGDFIAGNKVFIEQATAYYLYRKYLHINLDFLYELMPTVEIWCGKLSTFIDSALVNEHNRSNVLESKFVKEFLDIAENQGLLIQEYVDMVDNLLLLQEDMTLIKKAFEGANSYTSGLALSEKRELARFITTKGYRVDPFYLYKPTEEELNWAYTFVKYYRMHHHGYATDTFESSMEELLREAYEARKGSNYSLYTPIKSWHTNFPLLSGNKSVKISTLSLTPKETQKI